MIGPDFDDPLVAPFWRAAQNGRLSLPWCARRNRFVWYPEAGAELEWRLLSGRARLFSWTVVRKPLSPLFAVPYLPALVIPEEAPGVRLVTQLIDCEPGALRCDLPLVARFGELRPLQGEPFRAPLFTPAA